MVLLDRWGEGVSHVIGVGGRDLSAAVAGRSARRAVRALENDPATDVVLLVSKPPSPDVATAVVSAAATKPLVAALVGLAPGTTVEGAAAVSSTLEGGVRPGRGAARWSAAVRLVCVAARRGTPRLDGLGAGRVAVRRAVLRRHAVLRGADAAAAAAGAGVVEHAAR